MATNDQTQKSTITNFLTAALDVMGRNDAAGHMSSMTAAALVAESPVLIKALRTVVGMKQADLAAAIGQGQADVSRWELGQRRLDMAVASQIIDAISAANSRSARALMRADTEVVH